MSSPRLVKLLRSLAANVRSRRLAIDLTQEQLADSADIDINSLRRIELARTTPSLNTLLKIADALDIDIPQLLSPASFVRPRRGRPPKHTR